MQIPISQIHPSSSPVRQTWDEEKLQELTESIRDQGVIVPIKVRQNADGYEIVYGHRRIEAAKRAGLKEIPAEIEGLSDEDALVQQVAENFVRDDPPELDMGRALVRLNDEYQLTNRVLAKRFGKSAGEIGRLVTLGKDTILLGDPRGDRLAQIGSLAKKAEATRRLGNNDDRLKVLDVVGSRESEYIREIAKAIEPLPSPERHAVVDKASKEHLPPESLPQVAQVYQAIANESDEHKKRILKESAEAIHGSSPHYKEMVERRAGFVAFAEKQEARRTKKKRKEVVEYDDLVKEGLNHIRAIYHWMVEQAYIGIEEGKFSPEAARFVIRRFDGLVQEYESNFKPQLEKVGEQQ